MANLERVSGGLGTMARDMDERGKSERRLAKELLGKSRNAATALNELTKSASSASGLIGRMAMAGGLIGALSGLINVGNKLTQTYREMVNQGSTFNGSLLSMAQRAAEAGMPLEDFASAVKKSGTSVRLLGEKGFADFHKTLRKSMMQHGMYGMTTEQLTDFSAKYLETSRRAGLVSQKNSSALMKNFVELSGTTSALSGITGKARDEIAALAESALQGSMAMARIKEMGDKQGMEMNKQLQEAVATMSAQSGQAGDFFANALSETFGMNNRAEFSTQGQTLINAGMSNLASSLSALSASPSVEGSIDYMEEFRREVGRNLPMLRVLAMSGNESAKQLVQVHSQMAKMSKEELKAARKRAETQDGITKLFTTFGTWWDQLVGSFKAGLLKGFQPLFDSVGDFTKNRAIQRFSKTVEEWGIYLGEALGNLFKFFIGGGLDDIGETIKGWGAAIASIDWGKAIATTGAVFAGIGLLAGVQWGIIAAGLAGLATLFGFLDPILTPIIGLMKEFPLATGAAIAGFWLLVKAMKAKALFDAIRGRKTGMMNVQAGVVNVNGGGGPGDMMGGGGKGKKGFFGRMKNLYKRGGLKGIGRGLKGIGIGGLVKGGGRALAGGGLLGAGLEGLDYFMGDKAFTMKNLGKSALGLGGGALGGILGSLGGPLGTAAGGVGGYAAGSWLGDKIFGADDTKASVRAAKEKGMGEQGIDSKLQTEDPKAPKTQDTDPVLGKLDEITKATKDTNDLMVRVAQSNAAILKQQLAALENIRRNG